MGEMLKILDRGVARSLEELRLVKCQTTPELIADMLDFMTEAGTYISKLGLVQAQLASYHVSKLVPFIGASPSLKELDLSWNNLCPSDMLELSRCLAQNRQLHFVNLSWNCLSHMQRDMPLNDHVEEEEEMRRLENKWHGGK